MAAAADKIVGTMEALVPQDEGDLFASIGWVWGTQLPSGAVPIGTVKPDDPELTITIFAGSDDTVVYNSRGVGFQNALIQEFGTEDVPASPYFFPAWRLNKRSAKARIRRGIKQGLQRGGR